MVPLRAVDLRHGRLAAVGGPYPVRPRPDTEEAAAAGLVARPEQALTQCLLHGSAADPTVCPAVGSPGSAYYSVFWWHAKTPVLPFAFDEQYVVHGPLTEADDVDVVVPGITRPLAESSS